MTRRKKTKATRASRTPPSSSKRSKAFWAATGAVIVALAAVFVAASLLEDDQSSAPDAVAERGPVHVHGLGVDPADGTLYIATHTGMWRVAPRASKFKPVGESRQDTMGFTVVGPGHFLGSGHPDNFNQPPLLGLIESRDSGATWKPISLLGEADFHVLRAVGSRVYGYDVSNSRLMVSTDGGRTWTQRDPEASVLDLVPDPVAPHRVVATTEDGLLASRDAGETWAEIGRAVGLLGWPVRNRLYLVNASGDVLLSSDSGRHWSKVGSLGTQPAAFLAETSRRLYAALHDGRIVGSSDGGRTWRTVTA